MARLLVTSALALAGCSFIFVPSVSAPPTSAEVASCKESMAAPQGDTFIALVGASVGGIGLAMDNSHDFVRPGPLIGVIGLGIAAAFIVPAIYGYVHVSRCRDAREASHPHLPPAPVMTE